MNTQRKTYSIVAALAVAAGLALAGTSAAQAPPAKPATPPAAKKAAPPAALKDERIRPARPPKADLEHVLLDLPLLEIPDMPPMPVLPAMPMPPPDFEDRLFKAREALIAMPPTPALVDLPEFPVIPAMPAMPVVPAVPALLDFPPMGKDWALLADEARYNALAARETVLMALGPQSARERDEEVKQREQERKDRERERAQERLDREGELYDDGRAALDENRYERAVDRFTRVAEMNGRRADAALYWKAYALNKMGRRDDALVALNELKKNHTQSRWLSDAKALEVEVQQNTGQPIKPADADDCETKLLIINGMMHSDASRAVPILVKFLDSNQCPKAKRQALFVLAQSNNAEARDKLGRIARGESNPDLQLRAIQYLGIHGGREGIAVLSQIYSSTNDFDAKKRILNSFMVAGDREKLFAAAQNEKDSELRKFAINQLGVMGSEAELWQLWQKESDVDIKKRIMNSFFIGGKVDRLVDLAKTEKDPSLRRSAVNYLGLMGPRTGDALVQIYQNDSDIAVKKQVLNSFFLQQNATSLIAVARKETDPELRKTAIQKLSLINSKEATDFMMELLNK